MSLTSDLTTIKDKLKSTQTTLGCTVKSKGVEDASTTNSINTSVEDVKKIVWKCPSTGIKFNNGLTSFDTTILDISEVTNMESMFSSCKSLTSLDLTGWNTSKVTNMSQMFSNCSGLTSIDLSNFDTSNVTNMSHMFNNCTSLTSLDLSNFNTSKVTDMKYMFYGCKSLTSLNVSGWDISKVTSYYSMFPIVLNSQLKLILGEVTQTQYDWWLARLREANIKDKVTIEYTLKTE